MAEFPEYIRFDFLLVLLGLGSVVFVIYLSYFKEVFEGSEIKIFFSFVLLLVGLFLLIFGFFEMAQNYRRETTISELVYELKKLEFLSKLNRLRKINKLPPNFKMR